MKYDEIWEQDITKYQDDEILLNNAVTINSLLDLAYRL